MSSQNNGKKNRNIQRMAILLREGHILLSDACPKCNSPLFKMKSGTIYCVTCDKKVIREGKEYKSFLQKEFFNHVSNTITLKIKDLLEKITLEKDINNLEKITGLLLNYLKTLEKLDELSRK
ncbi:MAG: Sjogren's syndrome/scleroderma autoantigen 1 family protein [Promethearchaeota archaeon]